MYSVHTIPPPIATSLKRHCLLPIIHPPGSAATATLAAAQLGVPLAQIANTIVWSAPSGLIMTVISGDRRVSRAKLAQKVGSKVSKVRLATQHEVTAQLSLTFGAITPFVIGATIETLPCYIDLLLAQHKLIYPSGGSDCSSVAVSAHQLATLTGGTVCDIAQERDAYIIFF